MSFTPGPSLPSNTPSNLPASSAPAPAEAIAAPSVNESPDALGYLGRRVLLGAVGVAGLAALASRTRAGDLSPPAGPITPTGTTLTEIGAKTSEAKLQLDAIDKKVAKSSKGIAEPRTPLAEVAQPPGADCLYRITVPGAYCLTENVQQVSGVTCISIECDGVDLDGQGFSFVGVGDPTVSPSSCIRAIGRADIEVYDCAFRDWNGCCADCDDCDDCFFSDLHFRHCSCQPGFRPDGSAVPGAVIRCRDGCEIDDVTISSCDGGSVQIRDKSTICGVRWINCSGPVCGSRNACVVEELEIVDCVSGGGGGGGSGGMIRCGDGVIHRDISARRCTCPDGLFVSGVKWVCEDACLTDVTGPHVTCGRDACINKIQVGGEGVGIQCGTGSTIEAVSFHNHVGDCIIAADNCAVCDIECRACTGVAITCGAGACVEEVAVSSHTGDCVRCADGSCVTEVECRGCVGVCISVGASSLIEDCDVSGGGGGGGFRCLDGSTVSSCRSINRRASVDIRVTDRCCVEDCAITQGVGIDCGGECCVSANELSSCVERPPSTLGLSGAITVFGPHTSIDDNQLTECPVGISVLSTAHFCSVDDNHISSSQVVGITGGAVAGIVIAAGVASVMCTCNHLRVAPGVPPFIASSSSFGPLVAVTTAGSSELASAHHLSNYIVS